MANPEFKEQLDRMDIFQVILYRLGISIAGLSLFLPAVSFLVSDIDRFFQPLVILSGIFIASSLHIYDKKIRLIITYATWFALALFCLDSSFNLSMPDGLINGFFMITISGIAVKESFCFKIWGLKAVPLILMVAALAQLDEFFWVYAPAYLLAGLLVILMAIAKWRMPLFFDIGDKRNYQV